MKAIFIAFTITTSVSLHQSIADGRKESKRELLFGCVSFFCTRERVVEDRKKEQGRARA
jgi:hypothetical protein